MQYINESQSGRVVRMLGWYTLGQLRLNSGSVVEAHRVAIFQAILPEKVVFVSIEWKRGEQCYELLWVFTKEKFRI